MHYDIHNTYIMLEVRVSQTEPMHHSSHLAGPPPLAIHISLFVKLKDYDGGTMNFTM